MNNNTQGTGHHVPVLLGESLAGLGIRTDGCYLDATFGRGGHSRAILEALGAGGRLLAIDRDPAAASGLTGDMLADPRLELIRGEFSRIEHYVAERKLGGRMDGILIDLGVSSPQFDDPSRGFSFQLDGPLDMRMDPDHGESAAEWLAAVDEKTLIRVLRQFGEEPHAPRIARAIVAARRDRPIVRTGELAAIVLQAVPRRDRKHHPATRTFQAIRIQVNHELDELRQALDASLKVLAAGGRLCVISFHSLEDRIVKRFMRDASRVPEPYRGLPDIPPEFRPQLAIVGKAVTASAIEVERNPRARSARLRVAERL